MTKISRRFIKLINAFARLIGVKKQYTINGVAILLDYGHKLPAYQANLPYYDRFLPKLVESFRPGSYVVDVGANVGDTLAGMVGGNPKLKYISIEANSYFFSELQTNVSLIKKSFPEVEVEILKNIIGADVQNVSMVSTSSTASVVSGGELRSVKLSSVLEQFQTVETVRLIKSDVDGFDFDVIKSVGKVLSHTPLLFFECQYTNHMQYQGFRDIFEVLSDNGYTHYAIFDNLGQFLCMTQELTVIEGLLAYIASQNFADAKRTIFYWDVLAFNHKDKALVDDVLRSYWCH